MERWPWWLGSIAMASVALGYLLATRRSLGASGLVTTVLSPGARESEREIEALDEDALEAALLEATRREFGEAADEAATASTSAAPSCEATTAAAGPLGFRRSLWFLVGIVVGGIVFGVLTGMRAETQPLGVYSRLFGDGAGAWAALFVGGLLVGAGTSMAGGCTSGHGLVGCARLQPASLVTTATFLGTAIGVSLLLAFFVGSAQ